MDNTLHERLTTWRRHLHANPDLTLHEARTAAFVQERLRELGIPCVGGIGGHGVVATIRRGASNRSVGLRADMDALPIQEATGVAHASCNPGVMHACGHDGHTVSLLGAAALLAADTAWSGTVQLVFQPAEEGGGGARSMIEDGLFDRFPMERIFAYHNWPGLEAGTVAVHDGPVMAAGNRLFFTVTGHGGHAALPHMTRDPMVAAAHLLLALQSVVSRSVDPLDSAVVSIGVIQAGSAANQIPASAELRGTMRVLREDVREQVQQAIRRIARGVATSFAVDIDMRIANRLPVTRNTPAERDFAAEAARSAGLMLRRDMAPAMTGEDFSWFLQHRPGAFVWIGNGPADGGRELHNAGYDFNDAILPAASGYLAAVAKRALVG
ncbi:amidohydrolase [Rhodopila globiformis]|uniref:Amidohydrolase n=1 Tax=Rhodopila globiformis TaxID=1071 RepID=A0A2S6NLH7_RHOGL|nr:amidohydrolase [Rhodopila globiformis]PPQ36178.1 amidohydrolase [Rhodopila globiformis]